MFRNYLAAALRNLVRNRLYAAINIIGLAVGFAAAIFAALFVRDELTYDRWLPGYEQIYTVATTFATEPGAAPSEEDWAYRDVAAWMMADFPEVEAAGRIGSQGTMVVSRGDLRAIGELAAPVDPTFFATVPYPVVAGDLSKALNEPDGVVLTRRMARKYFGRDAPLEETIMLDQHVMRVKAVVEDAPSNSNQHLQHSIFISGRAPFSNLMKLDALKFGPETPPWMMIHGGTFVRLKRGASAEGVQRALPAFVAQHMPKGVLDGVKMRLIPLASIHLAVIGNPQALANRARTLGVIYGIAGMGVLIVLAAALNFVNAMTARAARRAVEVGVRKATGAARRQLIVQFLGEALIYTGAGMALAICGVVLLLPAFRAVLGRDITIVPDAAWAAGIIAMALVTGILAGMYPAFVLSSLRPAAVLKAGAFKAHGSAVVRQFLVMLQFAILIGVAVVTAVIAHQTDFAMNESLRFDKDQVLLIQRGCSEAMQAEVLALPGVRTASCSSGLTGSYTSTVAGPGGVKLDWQEAAFAPENYEIFDLFGVKPLAGRLFQRGRGEDIASADGSFNPSLVINETAARKLGFASPEAAVGQTISWSRWLSRSAAGMQPLVPSRIVGVVPDLSITVQFQTRPVFYYIDMSMLIPNGVDQPSSLYVKLTGRDVPETLQTIDRLWTKVGSSNRPIERQFYNQRIEDSYRDLVRQEHVIAVFASVALFIAACGLFGLSAFIAERRTKEIGVRKALGANRMDILRLLLWEFSKPVLYANAIAWPAAYVVGRRWLENFAYHIDLDLWTFLGASFLALAIAGVTVAGHTILVARAEPVTALRYE